MYKKEEEEEEECRRMQKNDVGNRY
jgi:hypothetical protein